VTLPFTVVLEDCNQYLKTKKSDTWIWTSKQAPNNHPEHPSNCIATHYQPPRTCLVASLFTQYTSESALYNTTEPLKKSF